LASDALVELGYAKPSRAVRNVVKGLSGLDAFDAGTAVDVQHRKPELQRALDVIILTRKRDAVVHSLRLKLEVAAAVLTFPHAGEMPPQESCVTDGLVMAQPLLVAAEEANFVFAADRELRRPVSRDQLLSVRLVRTKMAESIASPGHARNFQDSLLRARKAAIKACLSFVQHIQ